MMPTQRTRFILVIYLFVFFAFKGFAFNVELIKPKIATFIQIDSLIKEKSISSDMTQLELLVLYQDAWFQKHQDSLNILKKLALLNAELEQAKDAAFFTDKYIKQTLDFSILDNSAYESIEGTKEFASLAEKYAPKIDFMSLFYVFTSFVGLFFALGISFNGSDNKTRNLFISLFVFLHSLFIINSVLYLTNYMYKVPQTLYISASFSYLYGPLFYFYFKSINGRHAFNAIDLLHLLPTLLFVLYAIPIYALSADDKLRFMINDSSESPGLAEAFFTITKFLSLAIYTYAIHRIYLENKRKFVGRKQLPLAIKWQYILVNFSKAYVITYLFYGYAVLFMPNVSIAKQPQILIMSLSVLSIAFAAYMKPELFSVSVDGNIIEKLTENIKYQKSGLTNTLSNELKGNLIKLFVEDKVYKENNVTLEILSNRLNTTRHNTSQIINEHFGMNFFELINKFRIKDAVNMLVEDEHNNLNIIDVAYEVGYNNKVTFNKAFKKEMNVTPSEYLQSHRHHDK